MRTRPFNREVLYPDDSIVRVDRAEMDRLKELAELNARRRMRLCTHRNLEDAVHEMLIVHTSDTYVRPHKHLNRGESFHILEGQADSVFFDDNGRVRDVIAMGDYRSDLCFYYRLDQPIYHTLLIHSPHLLFHEATSGPFDPKQTVFAPWSPADQCTEEVQSFMRKLKQDVADFRAGK